MSKVKVSKVKVRAKDNVKGSKKTKSGKSKGKGKNAGKNGAGAERVNRGPARSPNKGPGGPAENPTLEQGRDQDPANSDLPERPTIGSGPDDHDGPIDPDPEDLVPSIKTRSRGRQASKAGQASKAVSRAITRAVGTMATKAAGRLATTTTRQRRNQPPKTPGKLLVRTYRGQPEQLRPSRGGAPLRSSWHSKVHGRSPKGSASAMACQGKSRTKIWRRDAVVTDDSKAITCGRCMRVLQIE